LVPVQWGKTCFLYRNVGKLLVIPLSTSNCAIAANDGDDAIQYVEVNVFNLKVDPCFPLVGNMLISPIKNPTPSEVLQG
jgi:hypothetical protein